MSVCLSLKITFSRNFQSVSYCGADFSDLFPQTGFYRICRSFLKCLHTSNVPRGLEGGGSIPTRSSEVLTKSNRIANWSENIYCSYSNILISLKIAEFSTPAPQDVRKKGSKILKLPRFAIVLHLQ